MRHSNQLRHGSEAVRRARTFPPPAYSRAAALAVAGATWHDAHDSTNSLHMPPELTQATLRQKLHYDPEQGEFTWREGGGRGKAPGQRAGSITNGYRYIRIEGTMYTEQRLAVLYVTGNWPTAKVDFKNGNTQDIRWNNLMLLSPAEIQLRRTTASNRAGRTSEHLGVSWDAKRQRWTANIRVDGKPKYLGRFKDELAASEAYQAEKARLLAAHPALGCEGPVPDKE